MNPHPAAFEHQLKFGRAFQHLYQLKVAEDKWLEGDTHTLRSIHDPKTRDLTFLATVTEQPETDPFSLLIGDCLHNMRSSLDVLAYKLATTYTKPLPNVFAEASEFPIFGDVDKKGTVGMGSGRFRDNGLAKIQGWDPKAQTVVEGLQPYQRGNAYETDPLWILHTLDRINKHRLLHAVAAGVKAHHLTKTDKSNLRFGPGVWEFFGETVDTDTPVVRFPNAGPADPSRKMHVDIGPALCIAFAKGTPCVSEEPSYQTLSDIYFYIGGTVFSALEQFL